MTPAIYLSFSMLLIMQAEKAAFDEAEKKREEEVLFMICKKFLSVYPFITLCFCSCSLSKHILKTVFLCSGIKE